MFNWLTFLRVRLDWVFNMYLNHRHPATMILKSHGFKPTPFFKRREYSTWRDGYRLCQMQEMLTPEGKTRFLMRIRLFVAYERKTKETPAPLFKIYWTFHKLDKVNTPVGTAFISESFILKHLPKMVKTSSGLALTVINIQGLMENSRQPTATAKHPATEPL